MVSITFAHKIYSARQNSEHLDASLYENFDIHK